MIILENMTKLFLHPFTVLLIQLFIYFAFVFLCIYTACHYQNNQVSVIRLMSQGHILPVAYYVFITLCLSVSSIMLKLQDRFEQNLFHRRGMRQYNPLNLGADLILWAAEP